MRGRGAARTNEQEASGLAGEGDEGEGERKVYGRDRRTEQQNVQRDDEQGDSARGRGDGWKGRSKFCAVRCRSALRRHARGGGRHWTG